MAELAAFICGHVFDESRPVLLVCRDGSRPLNAKLAGRPTMTTDRPSLSVLALLLAAGCSSSTYIEDLKTPALVWGRSRGLCGSGLAVDGDGRLWINEGGCEDGRPELTSRGQGDADKVHALRQAFDALPKDAGPDRSSCRGNLDSFSKRSDPGGFESRACASGTGSDLAGLQEPHLSVAMKFLALP
jgi:hypothetical protein